MYHLFCSFKNAQKPPCICVLHKRCPSKCCKIYRKTRAPQFIFNKVELTTLLKKTLTRVFSCEFFEIIKGDFFYKTPPGECFWMLTTGKILVTAGQRYHFPALWGFSFWMLAFSRTFACDVKTLSSSFLLKSEKISSGFWETFTVINVFQFGPGWSNGVHGSFNWFLIDILFVQFFLVIHRS